MTFLLLLAVQVGLVAAAYSIAHAVPGYFEKRRAERWKIFMGLVALLFAPLAALLSLALS